MPDVFNLALVWRSWTHFNTKKIRRVTLNGDLLEDRILSSFTDDKIRPLNNHNGNKEGGVTGILQDLSIPRKQEKYFTFLVFDTPNE